MDIRFTDEAPETLAVDAVVHLIGSDVATDIAGPDQIFGGGLLGWAKAQRFDGAAGTLLTAAGSHQRAPHLILLGVGDRSTGALRKALGRLGRELRTLHVSSAAIVGAGTAADLKTLVERPFIGNYAYEPYKAEDDRHAPLETMVVCGITPDEATEGVSGRAKIRVGWQRWTRDLVNMPPADLTPAALAQAAVDRLGNLAHIEVEVWDLARCEAEGLVGVVAVGQGSANPGNIVHIRYRPPGAREHIAFVGKGVTFDAGGLSLKPSAGMQTMRCDMGGAATVLGATGAIAELHTPIALDCFIGCVENMNDGNSYKLGDILKYRNGVTVEIHNTDAEGRLVLADCLINACAVDGVSRVVDAATLTGACIVAVGSDFTAIFTDDDALHEELAKAHADDGELSWRLPLHAPYAEKLRGEWGQVKNVGGREAGATTAALFLKNFVTDGVRWAHLDIAGSSWRDKAAGTYAAGATGEPMRALVTWAEGLVEN